MSAVGTGKTYKEPASRVDGCDWMAAGGTCCQPVPVLLTAAPPPLVPHPSLLCSLLVLLVVALFYAGAAIIYKLALSPGKDQKLLEAQRRRRTRRD